MVYRKYIKKKVNGKIKTFGPYYYESYRDKNGKTKTRYVGDPKKIRAVTSKSSFIQHHFGVFIGLIILLLVTGIVLQQPTQQNENSFSIQLKKIIGNITGFATEENPPEEPVEGINQEESPPAEISEDQSSDEEPEQVEEVQEIIEESEEENITEEIPQEENQSEELDEVESNTTGILEGNQTQEINESSEWRYNESNESIQIPETEESKPEQEKTFALETKRARIIINRPVKWVKLVNFSKDSNVTVEIPLEAQNITIKTGEEARQAEKEIVEYNEIIRQVEKKDIITSKITGMVSKDIANQKSFIQKFFLWLSKLTITGNVIESEDIEDKIIKTEDKKIVEITKFVEETETEIALEYFTPGPTSEEIIEGSKKTITISAPDEFNYENILAYTELEKEVNFGIARLYHVIGSLKELVEIEEYDLNSNGFVDYVEWNVEHLSNQTYELIIEITNAEHLDENRTFVSNIYEQVKSLDGIWSEEISENEFVRITFETNLTSERDITLFPKIISSSPKIEIYEVNGTEVIAEFSSLNENFYNKVFLENLIGMQDTFDLKILNGSILLDHIIDPAGNILESDGDCGINCNVCDTIEPSGYNTIDSCSDGVSCDSNTAICQYMWVDDVYIDNLNSSTDFQAGDTINITCQVKCWSDGTEYSIVYNNGSGWQVTSYGNCPSITYPHTPSGTCEDDFQNLSTTIILDDVAGTHTIRCQESWVMGATEAERICDDSDSYQDADDVNLTVVPFSGETVSESNANCGTACNLCNEDTATDSCEDSVQADCGSAGTDGLFWTNDIWVNGSFTPGGEITIKAELDSNYVGAYYVTGWQDGVKLNEFGCYDSTDSYTECDSGTYSSLDFNDNKCNMTFGSGYWGSESADFGADTIINLTALTSSDYHLRVSFSYNVQCDTAGAGNGYNEADGDFCEESTYGENDGLNITLSESNSPPTHDSPIFFPDPAYDNQNLSCLNQSTSDTDGDNVTNIYNWLKNGISYMLYYLPFDTNVSTNGAILKDYSGNGNNGTLALASGGYWLADCVKGGCHQFDGGDPEDNYISLTAVKADADSMDNYTMSIWIKRTGAWASNAEGIISKSDATSSNRHITLTGRGSTYGYDLVYTVGNSSGSTLITGGSIAQDQWYNLVARYSRYNMSLFVNGTLINSTTPGQYPLDQVSNNFYLGRLDSTTSTRELDGQIDEFMVFNESLSDEQVYQLYLDGLNSYQNSTIVSQELSVGDNWTCQVTPNDATVDGETKENSTVVQKFNTAPTHNNPIFVPYPSYDNQNLVCLNQSTSDIDGNSVTNIYNWKKDGIPIAVLNMPFDTNSSTTTKDYSGYENNGTLGAGYEPIWTSEGKIGGAYEFDGSHTTYDYIELPDDDTLDLHYNFSIGFWIKSNYNLGSNVYNAILSKYDNHGYYGYDFKILNTQGTVNFVIGYDEMFQSGIDSLTNVSDGNWHYVVGTYDKEYIRLYIDGIEEGNNSETREATSSSSGSPVFLGIRTWTSANPYGDLFLGGYSNALNGTLDGVVFYNISLTPEQIYQAYLQGLGGYQNSTIVSQELSVGDNWTCQVTPNDAIEDGELKENSTSISEGCGQIITESTIRTKDLFCTENYAINITGNNLIFDCSSHAIYSSEDYGIYVTGNNVTIQNCNIMMNGTDGDYGVYVESSVTNFSLLYSNVSVSDDSAIYLRYSTSSGNKIAYNTLSADSSYAIYLYYLGESNISFNNLSSSTTTIRAYYSDENTFLSNQISSSSTYAIFFSSCDNNLFLDNFFNASSYSVNFGTSSGNTFENNEIFALSNRALALVGTSNNVFRNSLLSSPSETVYFSSSENKNNTFINSTYEEESVGGGSELIRKWYLDSYVNDSLGFLENANISSYNISDILEESTLTDSNGHSRQELIEYINNGTKDYATPHTINVSKLGYAPNSTVYNLTEIQNIVHEVILEDTPPMIMVLSPTNQIYTPGNIWFNATADEEIDTWIVNYNGTNMTIDINTTINVEAGMHHLFLYANDTNGNWGVNDSIYFHVNTPPPPQSNPFFVPDPAYDTLNLTCMNGSFISGDPDNDVHRMIYNWKVNETSYELIYLPFDTNVLVPSQPTIKDYSGNGYNGVSNGLTEVSWTENGKIGGAYEFDGVGSKISLENTTNLDLDSQLTLEAWVNPSFLGSEQIILGKQDESMGYALVASISNLVLIVDGAFAASSTSLSTGNWNYVVGTWNGSIMKVYLNGLEVGSASQASVTTLNQPIEIGNSIGTGYSPFAGIIDEVKIYNRTLNEKQIYQAYLQGLGGYQNSTIVSQELSVGDNWTCQVTPNDAIEDGETKNKSILIESGAQAIAIDLSLQLASQINWTIDSLPIFNVSSKGNNESGVTELYINISTEAGNADVYVKSDGDLQTSGGDVLGIGNETYSYNITNSSVPSQNKFQLTTEYDDNKIGSNLPDGSVVFLKFFLNAPSSQPAGTYNNTLLFKAVPYGQSP